MHKAYQKTKSAATLGSRRLGEYAWHRIEEDDSIRGGIKPSAQTPFPGVDDELKFDSHLTRHLVAIGLEDLISGIDEFSIARKKDESMLYRHQSHRLSELLGHVHRDRAPHRTMYQGIDISTPVAIHAFCWRISTHAGVKRAQSTLEPAETLTRLMEVIAYHLERLGRSLDAPGGVAANALCDAFPVKGRSRVSLRAAPDVRQIDEDRAPYAVSDITL